MSRGQSPLWAAVGVVFSALVALGVALVVTEGWGWLVPWLGGLLVVALITLAAFAIRDERKSRAERRAEARLRLAGLQAERSELDAQRQKHEGWLRSAEEYDDEPRTASNLADLKRVAAARQRVDQEIERTEHDAEA